MFDGHEIVLHVFRLLLGDLQRGIDRLRLVHLVHAGDLRDALDLPVACTRHLTRVDLYLFQNLFDRAILLAQQRVQQMLLVKLSVLIADGALLRLAQRFD